MKSLQEVSQGYRLDRPQTEKPSRSIAGLFAPGTMNTLIAEQGTGKTLLAVSIAKAALDEGLSVAWIDADQSNTLQSMKDAGLDVHSEKFGIFEKPKMGDNFTSWDEQSTSDLIQILAKIGPDVVIIDTFGEFFGFTDELKAVETRALMRSLAGLASQGSCVIALDHTPKGSERNYRSSSQSGFGSSQKANRMDVSILLQGMAPPRGADEESTFARMEIVKDRKKLFKNSERFATLEISREDDGRLEIQVSDWRSGRKSTSVGGSEKEMNENLRRKITDYISRFPEGVSWGDTRDALKGNTATLAKVRDQMLEDGVIERTRPGAYAPLRVAQNQQPNGEGRGDTNEP